MIVERIRDFIQEHFSRDPWGSMSTNSTGRWRGTARRHDRGFQRLPVSPEEEESMIGHDNRFSIDDDDEDGRPPPEASPIPKGMDQEGVIRL